jgi:osmotically-inducible protein OsmY
MAHRSTWARRGLLYALLILAGCSDQDAERIGKVSNKALQKAKALTSEAGEQLGVRLPNLDVKLETLEVTARVQARVNWDQGLEDASIRVEADATGIRLTGLVTSEAQRRRAVELAESTAGVEKVTDSLDVGINRNDTAAKAKQ